MHPDPTALQIALSLIHACGAVATARVWSLTVIDNAATRRRNRYHLFYLLPAILLCAYLGQALRGSPSSPISLLAAMATDIVPIAAITLTLLLLRRALLQRRKRTDTPASLDPTARGDIDSGLKKAVDHFLAAVDNGNAAVVVDTYDPEFVCIRAADAGGFVRFDHAAMLGFWNRQSRSVTTRDGHSAVRTYETVMHYGDVIGDRGYTLLTRVKDLGSGREPLFYCLVWRRTPGEGWKLLREFVHQRSAPRWH